MLVVRLPSLVDFRPGGLHHSSHQRHFGADRLREFFRRAADRRDAGGLEYLAHYKQTQALGGDHAWRRPS